MVRIVVTHAVQSFGEPPFQHRIEIGPSGEHAVVVGRRRPNFDERALRRQTLCTECIPKRAADRAGFCPAIEDRSNDFDLASAGVAMLTDVAIKAPGLVVFALD